MKNVLLNTGNTDAAASTNPLAAPAAGLQDQAAAGAGFASTLAAQQSGSAALPAADAVAQPLVADPVDTSSDRLLAGLLQALLGEAVPAPLPALSGANAPAEGDAVAATPTDPTLLAALGLLPVAAPAVPATPPPPASDALQSSQADEQAQALLAAAAALPTQQQALQAPSQQNLGLLQLRLQQQERGELAMPAADESYASVPVAASVTPAVLDADTRKLLDKLGTGAADVASNSNKEAATESSDLLALNGLSLDAAKPQAGRAAAAGQAPVLELKGEPRQWQQPLMQALGDRLQVQIAGRSEQATIKLSPPMLGQVEISIRQQAGELQVRLSASHGEVTRQLQQVSEGLRQDLVQRHSGEVTVQVAQTGRDGDARQAGRDPQSQQQQAQDQREQQEQRRPGLALNEAGEEGAAATAFAPDLTAIGAA